MKETTERIPKAFIIILIVVMIISGIIGGIIGYNKFKGSDDEPEYESKEEITEKEVTSQELKNLITKKMTIVENIGLDNKNHEVATIYHYKDKTKKKDISQEDKLAGIINTLDITNLEHSSYEVFKRYVEATGVALSLDDYNISETYSISSKDIKDLYKDVYNEDLTSYVSVTMYPLVYYDSETDTILIDYNNYGGLGKISENIESYVYSIKEDNDNIYVYVAVGLKVYDEYNINCTYYYDVESKNKYVEVPCDAETLVSTINKDNYKDFTNYKVTFKKEENNYYFDSIEKTKGVEIAEKEFVLGDDKYIITTDMKYKTMQNDGGSHINMYYQIDLKEMYYKQLEDKYVGFKGYEYQDKVIKEEKLSNDEVTSLKEIIDKAIAEKDLEKDLVAVNYSYYSLEMKDKDEIIIVDEAMINKINEILK